MTDELVEKFSSGNFNQGSAISNIKFYNPKKIIVQHLLINDY